MYIKILIGMILGVIWGWIAGSFGLVDFTDDWIKPFGTIFINALKLIAVPLILISLIDGISNLTDMSKLSRIGGKTVALYLSSTVVAITIGLILVNTVNPGEYVSEEKKMELQEAYASEANMKMASANKVENQGPLQLMVDIIPSNLFGAMTDNSKMLQVIFFAIIFGVR